MQKFNLSRTFFDFEEQSSEESTNSAIYISSDRQEDVLDFWDLDWPADAEMLINMTMEGIDGELEAGSSSSQSVPVTTPKLSLQYFQEEMCYAPSKRMKTTKIELCKTLLPVL